MNPIARIPYTAAGALARAVAAVTPAGNSKAARALSGRRGIGRRYADWAAKNRDRARPLLWVHAPSVGEGLQALPVIQIFRARNPDAQLAYTFYSPSAEAFAKTTGADFFDYLPFDTSHRRRVVLDALEPKALVFSKLDVWPLLVDAADSTRSEARNVERDNARVLPPTIESGPACPCRCLRRARRGGRDIRRRRGRLVEAGVRDDRVTVTGDTRYDQAWLRAQDSDERTALLRPLRASRFTMVAGSTWPSDEERLLPAWLTARAAQPDLRLVIARTSCRVRISRPLNPGRGPTDLRRRASARPALSRADVFSSTAMEFSAIFTRWPTSPMLAAASGTRDCTHSSSRRRSARR